MMGRRATPGAIPWLHHSANFGYRAPTSSQEALVEGAFRRCRFDANCAAEELRNGIAGMDSKVAAVDAHEELLAWWCRRCWEDRHTKEAAEAVKRDEAMLGRGFVLASWCRFRTTARKAGVTACAATGGAPDLQFFWDRCRHARGWPEKAATAARDRLRSGGEGAAEGAAEMCCGESRCIARALEGISDAEAREVWRSADTLLGTAATIRRNR
eukprot:gnl/TRDRNA2_/TRDRNA2_134694_c0_seq1.p1 gnl/TRDRNA2_/TRDRNA2_134694_c0~~gnl/TRDRNA2_/TRDRNA2_134694_c0_seq1.p1  ORF type:complete len:213 (-),score=27.26 gnl/TRDRNA2_/TRDRNA2_134694_c0_seq1:171-809(-)